MKELTKKQKKIYEWIKKRTIKKNRILTIRDVAVNFKITPKGAFDHINAIKKNGFIYYSDNKSGIYLKCFRIVADE